MWRTFGTEPGIDWTMNLITLGKLLEHRMQLPECTVVVEFPRPPACLVLLRKGTASLVDSLLQDLYSTPHSHPCNIPSSGFKPVQARVR